MATNLTAKPPIISEPVGAGQAAQPIAVTRTFNTIPYRRVYVWELPVRIFHWLNAACILVLFATGLLIGWPQTLWMSEEPYQQYWFGWVRFIHFAAAYIFLFNILFRIYWSFVGNQYARWSVYVPYKRSQFKSLWQTLLVDITEIRERGNVEIGHNYMAAFTYFGLFFMCLFQIISGFGLYADMSDAWLPSLFHWIVPLMGGDQVVRQWHHIISWTFPIFTIIHVYLSVYHDFVEGRGTTSAIIGGWKFERDDELKS
jgi:Ni/Fe-hydrogenase 1 B-type cytochrome subunit